MLPEPELPQVLPALARAEKLTKRAAKVGFDWPDLTAVRAKIEEELAEVAEIETAGNQAALQEEIGDLLFAVMNVCRLLGFDGEETLHRATDKFISRFEQMEKNIENAGKKLSEMTLSEMDEYWEAAKVTEFH